MSVVVFAVLAGTLGMPPASAAVYQDMISDPLLSVTSSSGNTRWQPFGGLSGGCDGRVLAIHAAANGLVHVGGDFDWCSGVRVNGIATYDPVARTFSALVSNGTVGVPNEVRALTMIGPDLYVGGHFGVRRWRSGEWSSIGSHMVWALETDGSSLFAGGQFLVAGGVPAFHIARWDGSAWSSLGTGSSNGVSISPDNIIRALQFHDGELFVGGDFHSAGGQEAQNIAKWNGQSWSAVGSDPIGKVNTLTIHQGNLVAAGRHYAGQTNRIAIWNGTSWSSVVVDSAQVLLEINALASGPEGLYVTGSYVPDGEEGSAVLLWNGQDWTTLEDGNAGSSPAIGLAMEVVGGQLLVGGHFGSTTDWSLNGIATWDGNHWRALSDYAGHGLYGPVYGLAGANGLIYADQMHFFTGYDFVQNISRWDGLRWQSLGMELACHEQCVYSMHESPGGFFVGGLFTSIDGETFNNVARWNGSDWLPLGSGANAGVSGRVDAMVSIGEDLYVAGDFDSAGGLPAGSIALWDGAAWHALGGGVDGTINAMAVDGNRVYVAGRLDNVDGLPAPVIAFWNGNTWSGIGDETIGMDSSFSSVRGLAVADGKLYAAGSFRLLQPPWWAYVVRWDGTDWEVVADQVSGGPIQSIAAIGNEVFVGGELEEIEGQSVDGLARFDGTSWTSVDGLQAGDVSLAVSNLHADGEDLYVIGSFETAGGALSRRIAKLETQVLSGVDMQLAVGAQHDAGGTDEITYELDVVNRGSMAVAAASFTLDFAPEPADIAWTCTPLALAPAMCPQSGGIGPVDWMLDLPPATGVRLSVVVQPDTAAVFQSMRARLSAPVAPGANDRPLAERVLIHPVAEEAIFASGLEAQ